MLWLRIRMLLKIALFWLVFFILSRVFFLIYNFYLTIQLGFRETIQSFIHGFKLDLSLTGYLLFFLTLIMALNFFLSGKWLLRIIKGYQVIFIVLFAIITFIDVELYKNWGFHIDSTILFYLKTPKESLASTPVWLIILLLIYTGAFIWTSIKAFHKYFDAEIMALKPVKWYFTPLFLIFAGLLIIPIRGGLGIAPINVGAVFFSEDQFANHAAVNVPWNFGKSLTEMNKVKVPDFYTRDFVKAEMDSLLAPSQEKETYLLNTDKPNILIIILESFTGKVIGPLGGNPDATPNFTELTHQGIFFNQMYATGDRSDKGIVAILSGYPAQPTSSIIKYTSKTEKLPQLSKLMKANGYKTGFYYGGEINFANMNSYFVSGGYEKLVTMHDFPNSDITTKWGAHDQVVFNRLLIDLNQIQEPFFHAMFTLSSHDPFDVPHKSQFSGIDWDNRYLNSIHYSDSCLGDFIRKAQQSDWWKNTWVILIADHGAKYQNVRYSSPEKFHIPMLWLGGALAKHDTVITEICSQTDIPLMIQNQINHPGEQFTFSKDVLFGGNEFAYYAFNNGFGFVNPTETFVWDGDLNNFIGTDSVPESIEKQGKSFLQAVLTDFAKK